jgi:glyoxylase-like metal-dependent hydrolase (beta-lactamase superfamily II)
LAFRLGDRITGRISDSLERKYSLNTMKTGAVAPDLYAVKTDTVNFFVFKSGGSVACFDTGYRPLVIQNELRGLGIDPENVTHVFLTHADIDHVGGLRVFKNAEVYLSAQEERMIRGIRSIRRAVRSPRIRRDYHLLRDNDAIALDGTEVRAIETPGHTPGSMSYLVGGTYLFTGDTLKLKEGQAYAGKWYTLDYELQKSSIRKLASLRDVGCVITAHSGLTRDLDRAFDYWRDQPVTEFKEANNAIPRDG